MLVSRKPKLIDIPIELKNMKTRIKDEVFNLVYSKFDFYYLSLFDQDKSSDNSIKLFLLDLIQDYKFITYEFLPQSTLNKIMSNNTSPEINANSKVTVIMCIEGKTIIIDSIELGLICQIFNENQASKINISKKCYNSKKTPEESTAFNEVQSFYEHFKNQINNNDFVRLTIYPIVSFLIRRYYFPTNFFKDQTFFSFDSDSNKFEQRFKKRLENLFRSENNDQFKLKFPEFAQEILKNKNRDEKKQNL